METPETVKIITKGINLNFIWKVFVALLAIAITLGFAYWYYFLRGISWRTIKTLISEESKDTPKPIDTEHILMQGVKDIVSDFGLLNQARYYSKNSGIPLERVLVNNSKRLAMEFGYIATTPV